MAETTKDTSETSYNDSIDWSDAIELDKDLFKKILTPGEGEATPKSGVEVKVHYVGRLQSGKEFDSSRKRNTPFTFKLGQNQVIKGWEMGVASMKKGEKCLLKCGPEKAYGASGSPPSIPANATLIFEVELLAWDAKQNVTDCGGVKKEVLKAGAGYERPGDESKCTVSLKAWVENGPVFVEEKEATLHVGEDTTMILGLEKALLNMYKGERAVFTIAPNFAFGKTGNADLGIPANATVMYEIEMKDFLKGKPVWEMSVEEKIGLVRRKKEQGNEFYKTGRLVSARERYNAALKVFNIEKNLKEKEKSELKEYKTACQSNLSLVCVKLHKYKEALEHCTLGLELDPTNFKLLVRRGQLLAQMKENEDAQRDLKKALELQPNNETVKKCLRVVNARVRAVHEKQRKVFKGFFDKVQLVEEEKKPQAPMKAEAKPEDKAEEAVKEDAKMEDVQLEAEPKEAAKVAADADGDTEMK